MSFQFPASPTEGQIYAPAGGPQYVYRAPYWRASGRSEDFFWETRDALVAAIAGGLLVTAGKVYPAGGYNYIGSPGATAIPDLPGLLPLGDIHVEHFGAKGDLAYALQSGLVASTVTGRTQGYIRTAGTDDMAVFVSTDAYAKSVGGVYYASGKYYLLGQFEPTCVLKSGNNYDAVLWLRYSGVQTGIRFWHSGAKIIGFRCFGQFDPTLGSKPGGNGQLGTLLCLGEYYSKVQQQRVIDVEWDVLMCRAGNGAGQSSAGSFLSMAVGYHANCRFRLGVFGETNVSSNGLILDHWGCWYDTATMGLRTVDVVAVGSGYTTATVTCTGGGGGVLAQPQIKANIVGGAVTSYTIQDVGWGLTTAPTVTVTGDGTGATAVATFGDTPGYYDCTGANIIESYHAMDCTIEVTTPVHSMTDGHGLAIVVELAATGPYKVSDMYTTGAAACFGYGVGDVVDHYAVPALKGHVGKGIRVGHCSAQDGRVAASETYSAVVYLKGSGTSKISTDRYGDGSTALWQRQMEVDIEIDGLTATRPWEVFATGVTAFDMIGRVSLGSIETHGYGRGIEIEHSHADISFSYVKGDGDIRYEFSRGGHLRETSTDISSLTGATYAVSIAGREMPTTTTAAVSAGATKTPIVGIPTDSIHVKDKVKVGPYWVEATHMIDNGLTVGPVYVPVPYVLHTPLPGSVASGQPVIIDQHAHPREINLTSKGGEFGLTMLTSKADLLDATGFRGCGSHAIRLRSSSAKLTGKFPQGAGMNGVAGAYVVWGDSKATLLVEDSTVDANPFLPFQVYFDFVSVTEYGSVTFSKCRIADAVALFPTVGTSPARQVSMRECIDISAGQYKEMSNPFRCGSNANGFWKMHDDGTLECWLKTATSDANGDYTWTYPAAFNGGSSTVSVTASPQSVISPFFIGVGAPQAGSTPIKTRNLAGTPAAATFCLYAIGRWTIL